MKLVIAGGRDYKFTDEDIRFLKYFIKTYQVSQIITGGCSGADTQAHHFAADNKIMSVAFHADWKTYGKAAGPIRNQKMAKEGDAVILFPGGKGTQSMYNCAVAENMVIYDRRDKK